MATVRKVRRSKASSSLPENSGGIEETTPIVDVHQMSIWLHGVPKIGKTSWAAQFPNAVFGMTERGDKYQKIRRFTDHPHLIGATWEEHISWGERAEAADADECQTIVIDVLENAYDCCFEYMRSEMGLGPYEDPSAGQWNLCRQPFIQWCNLLANLEGKGCIFISHTSDKEVAVPTGGKTSQLHPALSGKPLNAVEGIVDLIAYMGYYQETRILQIVGDGSVMAGTRALDNNFRDADTGEPVTYVPMGKSASEGYENFIRAFNNEQVCTKHLPFLSNGDEPSKPKKKRKM